MRLRFWKDPSNEHDVVAAALRLLEEHTVDLDRRVRRLERESMLYGRRADEYLDRKQASS